MGFFKKLFKKTYYKISREVLIDYIEECIEFSYDNKLTVCDEFFLMKSVDDKDKLHILILNYDIPCKDQAESEKDLKGIVIFIVSKGFCNPETYKKYYSVKDFVDFELADFGEDIILNQDDEPVSLEEYKYIV